MVDILGAAETLRTPSWTLQLVFYYYGRIFSNFEVVSIRFSLWV